MFFGRHKPLVALHFRVMPFLGFLGKKESRREFIIAWRLLTNIIAIDFGDDVVFSQISLSLILIFY